MTDTETETLPVNYNVSDAAISEMAERFKGMSAKNNYVGVKKAIAKVRDIRVSVEKTRVRLKAKALAYGKEVDGEARRITTALREVEDPLKEAKAEIDDEKARVKAEEEAKEKERVDAIQAKINDIGSTVLRVYGKDADTIRGALADLDWNEPSEEEYGEFLQQACQVRAEQIENLTKAVKEREVFEEQQAELKKQQALQAEEQVRLSAQNARQEEEQRKLDEDKRKAEADKERERIEVEAKETAEREAREKLEREEWEREQAEEAARIAEHKRQAALPDIEKLHVFAEGLLTTCMDSIPDVNTDQGATVHSHLHHNLFHVRRELIEELVKWEEGDDG